MMTDEEQYDKLLEELENLVVLQYRTQQRKAQIELALGELVMEGDSRVVGKSENLGR